MPHRKLWEEMQANQRRLDECVGPHDFRPATPKNSAFGVAGTTDTYICTKCQGTLNHYALHWYERGLQHARKGDG